MRVLFVLFYCFYTYTAFSQHLPDPLLSALSGAGAYSTNHKDVYGVLVNPAAVAQTKNLSIGISTERRFALEGLQQSGGLIQFPCFRGGLGLQLDYAGSALMNELSLGLAYGKSLGSYLDVGIRMRYYTLNVPGYLRSSLIWAEAGFLFRLTDQVITGFSFSRSTRSRISPDEPDMTQVFRLGLGYQPSSSILLTTDWVKQTDRSLLGTCILLYSFEEGFHVRLGWNISTNQPLGGAGLNWKRFRTDLLISYHPHLGISPLLQCIWQPAYVKNKSSEN